MIKRAMISASSICFAAVLSTSAGQAQEKAAEYNTINFTEKFADEDGIASTAYARHFGVSLNQAKSELSLMNRFGSLSFELSSKFPESFSGVEATHENGLQLTVFGTAEGLEKIRENASISRNTIGLQSVLAFKEAPISAVEATRRAHEYAKTVNASGVEAVIASNARAGQFKIMAKSTTKALVGLAGREFRADPGTKIEQFDGIIPTASEFWGGEGYEGSAQECTLGFNVRQIGTDNYGASTAGHCDNTGKDALNGKKLQFQAEWQTNGVDSQWASVLGGLDMTVVPKFNNGYSVITVTGGQGDYAGLYICKYGWVTSRTCGVVDRYQYTDPGYGDFPRMNFNGTHKLQALEGDSGGPAFYGSLAVGQVHGRDGGQNPTYANMYYTPFRAWSANNLPIVVICDC